MDNVARRMRGLGLSGTKLRRHMMDAAAARRGDENVSTLDDAVRLLQAIQTSDSAVDLLKKPKESRFRKGLPPGVARPTSRGSSMASASTPALCSPAIAPTFSR